MSEEHNTNKIVVDDMGSSPVSRRRILKQMATSSAIVAGGATGLTGASEVAKATPTKDAIKKSQSVQRILAEVGNPTIQSISNELLDDRNITNAQLIVLQTATGKIRYIQLGDQKVGVQFQFDTKIRKNNKNLPEKYQQLPRNVQAYLLLNAEGDFVFIREATETERASLASATGVDDGDAIMFYNSSINGFIVETQPRKEEDEHIDVSSVNNENENSKELFLVESDQKSIDDTNEELHSIPLDAITDYVVNDSTFDAEDTVAEAQPKSSFEYAISSVNLSTPTITQIEQPTAQSPNCVGPECQCDEGDWSTLCAQSIVVCGACVGLCGGAISSGGLLLAACLACFGSSCNFAIPLSCSLFLECSVF